MYAGVFIIRDLTSLISRATLETRCHYVGHQFLNVSVHPPHVANATSCAYVGHGAIGASPTFISLQGGRGFVIRGVVIEYTGVVIA